MDSIERDILNDPFKLCPISNADAEKIVNILNKERYRGCDECVHFLRVKLNDCKNCPYFSMRKNIYEQFWRSDDGDTTKNNA